MNRTLFYFNVLDRFLIRKSANMNILYKYVQSTNYITIIITSKAEQTTHLRKPRLITQIYTLITCSHRGST